MSNSKLGSGNRTAVERALLGAGAGKANAFKVQLSPRLAKSFLGLNISYNRPVSQKTVERYASLMNQGRWVYSGQGIVFNCSGEMINGQHTCEAVVLSGISVPIIVVMDADSGAYDFLDQGKPRGGGDYMFPEESRGYRGAVASAVRMIYEEEQSAPGSDPTSIKYRLEPCDHPKVFGRYPAFNSVLSLRLVDDGGVAWRSSDMSKLMAPSAAIYSMVRTGMYDFDRSREFWVRVLDGAMLEKGDPRHTLHHALREGKIGSKRLLKNTQIAYVIKAWDSFLRGAQLKLLRWNESELFPQWPGLALSFSDD